MTRKTVRRLRTPAFTLVFGSIVATSVGISQSWLGGSIAYAFAIIFSVAFFFWGAGASDTSAVVSGRADERQEVVRLQSAFLALVVTVVALGIACLVSALEKVVIWPYEVIIDLLALTYLVGLQIYGAHLGPTNEDEDPL
jgi:hypothetical protein